MSTAGRTAPQALAACIAIALAGAAGAEPASPPEAVPYRDRIIAPDSLQPLPPGEEEEAFDDSGPVRSMRVEIGASHNSNGSERFTEYGVSLGGFRETPSWGSLSLDAALFDSQGDRDPCAAQRCRDRGGTATLWQRNLHLDGRWRLDNGFGSLSTPSLPLQREQYRFFLPSVPLAGVSTHWRHEARELELQAAFGRAGRYEGTRTVGFEIADGDVAAFGAQWAWAPGWTGAASYLGTYGRIVPGTLGEPMFEPGDTRGLHLTTAWADTGTTLRLNLLGSDTDRGRADGAWLDGEMRRGRYQHHYGVYRLEPELAWGAYPIHNDAEGGYYRLSYDYGRWHWNGGLDLLQSVSEGDAIAYATGYARYQATSRLGIGGGLSLRQAPDFAYSAQLFTDRRNAWGQTRLQFDQARAAGDDQWQLGIDHAFTLRQGSRLSVSIGIGHLRYRDASDTDTDTDTDGATSTATFALHGGRDLTDRLRLDGSARWTHGNGVDAVRGVDVNLGLDWRIATRWSLNASLYQSQGSRRSPFILDPLITRTPYIALPRERSMLVTLRYQHQAGRPQGIIGGPPGAASGGVRGSVFLDENGNGVREASELPVANVTIVLDARYSVRSDSDGRFEFPRVAVGSHTLTVESDNLPLPWSFDSDNAQRAVEVEVRKDARIDLGAQRPR